MSATSIISGIGKVASNQAVQDGAAWLINNMYGKIAGSPPQDKISLGDLATKEDLAASFAFLQTEFDRRNRLNRNLLIATLVTQAVTVTVVLFH